MRAHFFLVMLFLITQFALADTTWVAGGDVSGNWTAEGSPYMILGNLTVPPSQTLSIGPGVTVFFAARCSVLVSDSARIEALGAEGDSIYFTTDTLQLPERWGGIEIDPDADTCRFEWCVIENAVAYGINAWSAPLRMHASVLRYNRAGGEAGAIIHGNDYLELTSCVFQSNSAGHGGAMLLADSRGRIEDCVFRDNDGGAMGGAIDWFSQISPLVLRNCDFIANTANLGGAVALEATYNGYPRYEDCQFIGNTATDNGGAVSDEVLGGGFTFVRCWFEGNQAPEGGAMWVYPQASTQSIVDQCVFWGNSASDGGAIYIPSSGALKIQRSTIVNNAATGEGGGIYVSSASYAPTLYATIVALNAGGGLRMPSASSSPYIKHNLLFGNLASNVIPPNSVIGIRQDVNFNGDSCDLNLNIIFDPEFVDTAAADYHLLSTSPCIDAGPPWNWFPRDADSTIADIGAFYYDQTTVVDKKRTAVRRSSLTQNYPNPFNAVTRIEFDLPRAGNVELNVFDLTGRRVAELIHAPLSAGHHTADFDAARLPSGVYFYRLRADGYAQTQKMVLLK